MATPLFRAIDSFLAIGRCTVVRDPFGNPLVMVDMARGPMTAPPGT